MEQLRQIMPSIRIGPSGSLVEQAFVVKARALHVSVRVLLAYLEGVKSLLESRGLLVLSLRLGPVPLSDSAKHSRRSRPAITDQ